MSGYCDATQKKPPSLIGVSAKTALRRQNLQEFERAHREARMAALRQSTARPQQAYSSAVTTLLKILVDPAAFSAVKARCAYYILDQIKKAVETEEIG